MQRTDTEMLDFLLPLCAARQDDKVADFVSRYEALAASLEMGLAGREAISLAMGAQIFEPGAPLPPAGALDLIADEVKRVRETEGFDPDHDDAHSPGELAAAGSAYALAVAHALHPWSRSDAYRDADPPRTWPFEREWWKFDSTDPKRALVKAGQFIVAELDRELRKPTPLKPAELDECTSCREVFEDGGEHACPVEITHAVTSLGGVMGEVLVPSGTVIAYDDAIRKGDRVRVVRHASDWEGWVPAMGLLVGNEYVVEDRIEAFRIYPATVRVSDWYVPASCCELVP